MMGRDDEQFFKEWKELYEMIGEIRTDVALLKSHAAWVGAAAGLLASCVPVAIEYFVMRTH